jgi:hypothetical protein
MKNEKKIQIRRSKKIEKQKKKKKEIQKRAHQKNLEINKINSLKNAFYNSEEIFQKKILSFTEDIEKTIISEMISKKKDIEEKKEIENFMEKSKEIINIERIIYYSFEEIMTNLFERQKSTEKIFKKIKENKEKLNEKIKSVLEERIFKELNEEKNIIHFIDESIKEILDKKKREIKKLTTKSNEAKYNAMLWITKHEEFYSKITKKTEEEKKIIDMIEKTFEQYKKEIQEAEKIQRHSSSIISDYHEEYKKSIKKIIELKDSFIDSIKKNQFNEEDLKIMLKKMFIKPSEIITEYLTKKIISSQRNMDYFISGVYDTLEEFCYLINENIDDLNKTTSISFFLTKIKENNKDYSLRIECPIEENCKIQYDEGIFIPSFSGLEKMNEFVKEINSNKNKNEINSVLISFFREKTKKNFTTDLLELIKSEKKYNFKSFWKYAQKKKEDIDSIHKIIQTLTICPELSAIFENKNITNIKTEEILKFLEEHNWKFRDEKTLADVISKNLSIKQIKEIIKDPSVFYLYDNSDIVKKIIDDERIKEELRKNETDPCKLDFCECLSTSQ